MVFVPVTDSSASGDLLEQELIGWCMCSGSGVCVIFGGGISECARCGTRAQRHGRRLLSSGLPHLVVLL